MTIHISLNYNVAIQLVALGQKRAFCVSAPKDYNLEGCSEEFPNTMDLSKAQDWILNIPAFHSTVLLSNLIGGMLISWINCFLLWLNCWNRFEVKGTWGSKICPVYFPWGIALL